MVTGAAFYHFEKKKHSLPITAQALKLTFFFLVETKMEIKAAKKRYNLREINSSKLASFAGGWRLLSNFRRIMTAKLRQLKFE